jgi:hypothetical protein
MCLCVLKNIVVLSYIYIRATIFHVELRNCHVFMRSQKHRGVKLWIYIDIGATIFRVEFRNRHVFMPIPKTKTWWC